MAQKGHFYAKNTFSTTKIQIKMQNKGAQVLVNIEKWEIYWIDHFFTKIKLRRI